MKPAFFRKFSLQTKFILATSSAVILLMLLIGVMVTEWERKVRRRAVERQGMILAESLAIPIINALLYERVGLVEEGGLIDTYVSGIYESKDIDIIYLIVLDEEGRVIAHNDFSEYGKVYDDEITVNALASDYTMVQEFYDGERRHRALDFATPLLIGKKRWGTLKFGMSLQKLDDALETTTIGIIISTLVLLIGGLIIIRMLSRSFISPIMELAQTMEHAGGDKLDVEVDIKGSDEIALLGQNFNRMIERIRQSNLELKQTHEKLLEFIGAIEKTGGDELHVEVDIKGSDEIAHLCQSFNRMIERIRQSNFELKQTHEKLLQSKKLASMGILASGVAHEINNPLGGMFNCVQMLEKKGNKEELRKRYLELLKDGLSRIETTVGKLLWMSRKEGKNPQAVDIQRSLEDVLRFVEYRMKKNKITYKQNIEGGISVFMDPHDFQQVIINLMINAVQSMKNGGTLGFRAYRNKSKSVIELSDTGEGIDEENLHKIFDPFYSTKQPGEGTGLGLWLTYEIVSNYDGEISVHSRKGEGSVFTIAFN